MIKKFSSSKIRSRQFVFAPKGEPKTKSILHPPKFLCPQEESNFHPELRKLIFYPLNYEGIRHKNLGGQVERREQSHLRKPTSGLRHAVGSLRRTESGEGGTRTHKTTYAVRV